MALCAECRQLIYDWQDTKPSVVFGGGIRFNCHAAYDDTPAGVAGNRRRRWEDWRDLVNFQTDLIRRLCASEQHVGQGVLFEVAS